LNEMKRKYRENLGGGVPGKRQNKGRGVHLNSAISPKTGYRKKKRYWLMDLRGMQVHYRGGERGKRVRKEPAAARGLKRDWQIISPSQAGGR